MTVSVFGIFSFSYVRRQLTANLDNRISKLPINTETRLNRATIGQKMNTQDPAQAPSFLSCISRALCVEEQPPTKIHRRI